MKRWNGGRRRCRHNERRDAELIRGDGLKKPAIPALIIRGCRGNSRRQGPSARLGKLDYVINRAMIGGFALVAWPAEYRATGVRSIITSYDGVVYQKDLGSDSARISAVKDRYDPDKTRHETDGDWRNLTAFQIHLDMKFGRSG